MSNSLVALTLIRAVDAALKESRHEYGEMTDKFLAALHAAGFEIVPTNAAPCDGLTSTAHPGTTEVA